VTSRLTVPGADHDPFDVRVEMAGGRVLTGTVAGVNDRTLLSASYSRVAPRHRIAAWVRFLALAATHPEQDVRAATVGRGPGRDEVRVCLIEPLAADAGPDARRAAACAELEALVDLYRRGMREPLPLFPKTAAAWAEARRVGQDPEEDARRQWETRWYRGMRFEGEDADLSHQLVLGGAPSLATLLEVAPSSDETGDGWAEEEPTRLGRLARRYWDGLAAAERSHSA
jgi:exodeoxyribonuclease V gamma subunit